MILWNVLFGLSDGSFILYVLGETFCNLDQQEYASGFLVDMRRAFDSQNSINLVDNFKIQKFWGRLPYGFLILLHAWNFCLHSNFNLYFENIRLRNSAGMFLGKNVLIICLCTSQISLACKLKCLQANKRTVNWNKGYHIVKERRPQIPRLRLIFNIYNKYIEWIL